MAGVGLTDLNGWYKTRYGEAQKLVPEWAVLQGMMPFQERKQVGKDFREPIFLSREQGATFVNGSNLGTIQTLNDAVPLHSEEAVLVSNELHMRSQIAYGAIAAAWSAGPAAFGSAMDEVILGLDDSHRYRVEALMLYGGASSLGAVLTSTSVSSGVFDIVFSSASWAPGIWVQAKNARIDVYDTVGGTKRNTSNDVVVSRVTTSTKTIRVTGDNTELGTIAAGDVVCFKGAGGSSYGSMHGVDAILTNTGSLFNIDAATYSLWKANSYPLASAAPLTMSGIHAAAGRVVENGGYGDLEFLVSHYSWIDLMDDQAALRRYTESTKSEMQNGTNELKFFGVNGGSMTIRPHPMVKAGEAFGLMTDEWVRSGVSDLTNKLPGVGNDDFFLEVPDKTGCEVRNFSSQFVYCRKPCKQVKITNIVPRSAP